MKYAISVSVNMSCDDPHAHLTRMGYNSTEMNVEVETFEDFGALLAEFQKLQTRTSEALQRFAEDHR